MSARIFSYSQIDIAKIIEHLHAGYLLALPTETVYGLAADASNEQAIQKVFHVKGRPDHHPLIVHIAPPKERSGVAQFWESSLAQWSSDVPPEAIVLAKAFWPGPLTLVLKKGKHVSSLITGGQDSIAIRAPRHSWAIEILQAFPGGLVAPSANRFGRISPTSAQHVFSELGGVCADQTLMILDGGDCSVGIESTIVDLSRLDQIGPVILRPGMIVESQICAHLGLKKLSLKDDSLRHSGGILGHYAPQTPLISKDVKTLTSADFGQALLAIVTFSDIQELRQQWPDMDVQWIHIAEDPENVARNFYGLLRDLDEKHYQKIIFDQLPKSPAWTAIQDRLTRSVYGSGAH